MRGTVAVAALAALALTSVVTAAEARPARRPDLAIARGHVTRSLTRLTVVATVANLRSGHGRSARRTTARILATSGSVTRELRRASVPALANGQKRRLQVHVTTSGLAPGRWSIRACADATHRVRERRAANNCRALGRVTVTAPAPLCATRLCAPLRLATDEESTYSDATGRYWAYVPSDVGTAPASVLIWLHGCGGDHSDSWGAADHWGEHYIALLPDGAEGGCWDMRTGPDRVVGAVRSAIAHFNIDPKRIVIGGYSSGGDLAYRTAFLHAGLFAGLLAMNTSPFRDNGTSAAIAAQAAWRFPIYHLAHNQDETYPLGGVGSEIGQLEDAGFKVDFQHIPGKHWSEPSEKGAPDGTWWDFEHRLVKDHMGLGWTRP